ncbi:MAG: hypothetical protein GHCLOJNM_00890 [bacterium]|nr:hypothetical protein [bacterium]
MLARPYNLAPRIRAEESDSPHELCGTQVFLRPKATLLRVHETGWHPPTDIYETSDAYHVKIEMGGMHREDISVHAEGRVLTIAGKRCDHSPETKIKFRRAEIKYGQFEVSLEMPLDVNVDLLNAAYDNGFLEVRLPKKPGATFRMSRITIRIGA